jgi:hypothetical protein
VDLAAMAAKLGLPGAAVEPKGPGGA